MIEVRPARGRMVTRAEGRTTEHSFSFGEHYDPDNTRFAGLVAHNDEHLPPGTGYPDHRHRDLEIVSVVLTGALEHRSPVGSEVLGPGAVQRLSAGDGVVHAETSAAAGVETRFLQAWVLPDEPGGAPSWEAAGNLVPGPAWACVAGGRYGVPLGARGASLHVARSGGVLALPEAPRLHLFVAEGAVALGERELREGDAARLVDEPGRPVTGDALLVCWAFD